MQISREYLDRFITKFPQFQVQLSGIQIASASARCVRIKTLGPRSNNKKQNDFYECFGCFFEPKTTKNPGMVEIQGWFFIVAILTPRKEKERSSSRSCRMCVRIRVRLRCKECRPTKPEKRHGPT